jgi:hypothetical protein
MADMEISKVMGRIPEVCYPDETSVIWCVTAGSVTLLSWNICVLSNAKKISHRWKKESMYRLSPDNSYNLPHYIVFFLHHKLIFRATANYLDLIVLETGKVTW